MNTYMYMYVVSNVHACVYNLNAADSLYSPFVMYIIFFSSSSRIQCLRQQLCRLHLPPRCVQDTLSPADMLLFFKCTVTIRILEIAITYTIVDIDRFIAERISAYVRTYVCTCLSRLGMSR